MDKQQQAQDTSSVTDRRAFLQTAGKAAVVAPAASLLLSASSKSAKATSAYTPVTPPINP